MSRELSFEFERDDVSLWVEASVAVREGEPIYADERGPFGPNEVECEIDWYTVINVAGVDVTESIGVEQRLEIETEIEVRALE